MLNRLNDRQRIALAVAVAFAGLIVGTVVDSELTGPPRGGWFGYVPTTSVTFVDHEGVDWWARAGWWLLVIAGTTALVLGVLRDPPADDSE